ncbi:unnamed protein product [Caenorhabditis nigoni]
MWLLLFMIPGILISTGSQTTTEPILDCGFLNETFQYTTTVLKKDYNYSGECCNSEAVRFLDEKDQDWRLGDKVTNVRWATRYYKCGSFIEFDMTTSTTTSTTTTTINISPKLISTGSQTTTETILDCGFLNETFQYNVTRLQIVHNYSGECCNSEAVQFLNGKDPAWRSGDKVTNVRWATRYYKCGSFIEFDMTTSTTNSTTSTTKISPNISSTTVKLDCFWLQRSFSYPAGTYDGSCCISSSVNYMDNEYPSWATEHSEEARVEYVKELRDQGFCEGYYCDESFPNWGDLDDEFMKTLKCPIITEPACFWLAQPFKYYYNEELYQYSCECCNSDAVKYLSSYPDWEKPYNSSNIKEGGYIRELNRTGHCGGVSTTPSTTTTIRTTTETTSIPTTSNALNCGVFNNTECCTESVTKCLDNYNIKWSSLDPQTAYEYQLKKCECTLSTTSTMATTTTNMETTTTTSKFNCSWLSVPFEDDSNAWPAPFSYNGSCCSKTAVDTLKNNSLGWVLDKADVWIKRNYLMNLLYCTEGACTYPPLWENCSLTTSSSSSTTSPQTTTSVLSSSLATTTDSTTSDSDATSTDASSTSSTDISTTLKNTRDKKTTLETTTAADSTTDSDTTTPSETTMSPDSTSSAYDSSTTNDPEVSTSPTASSSTARTTATDNVITSTATIGSSSSTTATVVTTAETTVSAPKTTTPLQDTTSSGNSTSSGGTTAPTTVHSLETTTAETTITTTSTNGSTETTLTSPTITVTTSSNSTTTTSGGQTTLNSSSSTSSQSPTSSRTPTTTGITGSSSRLVSTTISTKPGTTTNVDGVYFRNTTVQLFENCTQLTRELLFFVNGTILRNDTVEFNACSSTTPLTTPIPTTTFDWPTGTTRILPSGEIILSEVLQAFPNCTTVLKQLIFNPSTNETREEVSSNPEGCKTTFSSSYVTSPMTTPTPSTTAKTTTYNWPTGGTTRILPNGDIILSESLIAYKNCTTVLMQLIYTPSTNETRTETTVDEQGCKASSTTISPSKYSTTPMSTTKPTQSTTARTTTFNWPTGGTTRVLPSGEIILSESLIAYKNCTTVLMQLIYNPSTNETRTETTTDAQGCKASSSTSSKVTTTPMPTTVKSTTPATTTFAWPTGGTTRTLPSGEIILSESLIAYKNCTTVLMQLIYNPKTNTTRTESTSDAEGCKATTTTTAPSVKTTTYNWPTGGTTRVLPSGEIILSESLIAYKNCTTVLMQLIYNPTTNTTRTETTSDAEGCKATSSSSYTTTPMSGSTTPSPSNPTTTFAWPTGGTTRILPSGEIIISESLIAYKNCTTVLMQLIYNPSTNTTRTETTADAQGCKASSTTPSSASNTSPMTTSTPTSCVYPDLDLTNTIRPTEKEVKTSYSIGEQLVHICKKYYAFEIALQPFKLYQCMPTGKWAGVPEKCIAEKRTEL